MLKFVDKIGLVCVSHLRITESILGGEWLNVITLSMPASSNAKRQSRDQQFYM